MRFKSLKIFFLLLCILVPTFVTFAPSAANYEESYSFQMQYGLLGQKLYVSILSSLYNYYGNMTHVVFSDSDYQQFITPQTVKPIADVLRKATQNLPNNDEQFADAVLTMVHQIPYVVTGVEYPVETIVNNSGDCVGLSLLAASIMKAGGLDVILIRYEGINPGHINVGVYLPYTPAYHSLLLTPTGFSYNNRTYWTAEATPKMDWKVGDQSDMVANAKAVVVSLDDSESSPPGQVSARLGSQLQSSYISANLSSAPSNLLNTTRGFTISGSIYPALAGQTVTIYIYQNESSNTNFQALTDIDGQYSFVWNFNSSGTYYVTASWSGNSEYTGADSNTVSIFVGPESFVQFQTPDYNYILVNTTFAYYIMGPTIQLKQSLPPLQGVKNFQSLSLQTNITFSYSFIILQTGHPVSNIISKVITIPAHQENISIGRHMPPLIQNFSAQNLLVPEEIPDNMGPLTLPEDINETINNQFCFQLQNNGYNNYSLSMRDLNAYDIENFTTDKAANTALLNVSSSLQQNIWYRVTENISDSQLTAQIKDSNGTTLGTIATYPGETSLFLLAGNNVDSAVIMQDFQVQIPYVPPHEKATNNSNWLLPAIILVVVLIASFSVAAVYVRRKKRHNLPRSL